MVEGGTRTDSGMSQVTETQLRRSWQRAGKLGTGKTLTEDITFETQKSKQVRVI